MPQVTKKDWRKDKHRPRDKRVIFGLIAVALTVVVSSFTVALYTAKPASALGSRGPDPGDFTGSRTILFEVDNSVFVGATKTSILNYFTTPGTKVNPNTITITSSGLRDIGTYDSIYSNGGGAPAITNYTISLPNGGTLNVVPGYVLSHNSVSSESNFSFEFWLSGAPIDPGTQTYPVQLSATLIAPNNWIFQNGFYVTDTPAASGEAIVGYDSKLSSTSFAMYEQMNNNDYTDWDLKFGADCSVVPPGGAPNTVFKWYDPDNGSAGIQPKPTSFRIIDRGLIGKPVTANIVPLYTLTGNDGAVLKQGRGDYYVVPGKSSKTHGEIQFTALSGHRYSIHWYGVYSNNTLQFQLPFDGIYYSRNTCNWDYTPALVLNGGAAPGIVTVGQQIKFYGKATASGFVKGLTGQLAMELKKSITGSWVDLKVSSFTGLSPGESFGTAANTAVTFTIPPLISAPVGTVYCGRVGVNPDSSAIPAWQFTPEQCWTVGSPVYPGILAQNGDVHVGGSAGSPGNCGNNGPANIVTGSTNPGSIGQYVVSATGVIQNFGSGNSPLGTSSNLGKTGGYLEICRPDLVGAVDTYIANRGTYIFLTGDIDISILDAGVYYANSGVKLYGIVNSNVTIYAPNGVEIKNSISQTTAVLPSDKQPSLGIIAKGDIKIDGSATKVDAYLFSDGAINTCNIEPCTNTLTVNGFLMAKILYFHRYGPVPVDGTAAEIINLTGQLYLNPPPFFSDDSSILNVVQGKGERPPLN